eukprot:TRINITY_DN1329_c0_g1_i1.p1 TRINITY_DN1329_c0_g1~~TRINITY_DN1329_c0_g1_i1.p1  ORF type:complete len:1040 (-),score=311.70 TRINITY_DN1329_c0_g1_i1:558-3677(-)
MEDNNNASERDRLSKEKKKAKEAEKAAKDAKFKAKEALKAQQAAQKGDSKKEQKESTTKKPAKIEEPAYVNTTPEGEKKDTSGPMRNAYDPVAVESAWYSYWQKKGFFTADNKSTKEKFTIVIPPPNVTGSLHLGHALTNSVQDAITRWHRMNGREALWVPGTDHAGIATQSVVEKKLKKENITKFDLGREKFTEQVWKWKEEYGGKIVNQLKRIGSSLDWSREAFTMDEKLSRAVVEAFIRFFKDGKIYRDLRLVNWCCRLNTVISDIEVDHIELEKQTKVKVPGYDKDVDFGIIVDFAYRLEGSEDEIVVSTTRPETMLGDVAVAVHPNDPRYKKWIGRKLVHPFIPGRRITIIGDDKLVDPEFGTGAVKVTPAHDPNDYQCGKRHGLELITIFTDDGKINENGGQFQGLKRFDARSAVIEALKKEGLYRGLKDNKMSIGICSRSGDIIEPLLKPQWWVDCKDMAKKAVEAVRNGDLELIPSSHNATWYNWLENVQDWCISRQLWWGHRCPAYLVLIDGKPQDDADNNSWVVGRNTEEAMKEARAKYPKVDPSKITLQQDPDVLDTWFSSGLFPFSVFGWPEQTPDMAAFYPTSLLETGSDILFFWVARMVMMGQYLTGQLPFKQVFLHAMVRDAHGRKMSKSLGNVIDPLDMITGIQLQALHEKLKEGNLDPKEIEKATQGQKEDFPSGIPECGTDAMRFALCAYTSQDRDINLDINRVVAYRNFCNKMWNATKFALTNLGPNFKPQAKAPAAGNSVWDKWILSRLNFAINEANDGMKNYDFARTTTAIYNFWLYELCDVYLESLKPLMQKTEGAAEAQAASREVLYTCLDNALRLLHPFMPFVTEELYQRIGRRESEKIDSIVIAPYPQPNPQWSSPQTEQEVTLTNDIIHAIRAVRASYGLTKQKPKVTLNFTSEQKWIPPYLETITFLSHSGDVDVVVNQKAPEGCAVSIVNDSCSIYIGLKGEVDLGAEVEKLEKKKEKLQASIASLEKQMASPNYVKVPEKLKGENADKLAALKQEFKTADETINGFKKLM